ncbi:MAG: hypothetical protein FJ138_16985, partial [Deltaproteobacteria bacterium]|nr:hypothetical protein [Deltaproteobacteria bacterium]
MTPAGAEAGATPADLTPPTAPAITELTAVTTSRAELAWSPSQDPETPTEELTYELLVARTVEGLAAAAPHATSAPGATRRPLTALPPGPLAVAVRARDGAGNLSPLSPPALLNTLRAPAPALYALGRNFEGQVNGVPGDPGEQPDSPALEPFPALAGRVVEVAAGTRFSVALTDDGAVWTWGRNTHGELGVGTLTDTPGLQRVLGLSGAGLLSGVTRVVAQGQGALALLGDGRVALWGNDAPTPYAAPGLGGLGELSGVVDIAAGEAHALALLANGNVVAWGDPSTGNLGDGGVSSGEPTLVKGLGGVGLLEGVTAVASGGHCAYAVLADGRLASWGADQAHCLGDGPESDADRLVPGLVRGLDGAEALTGVRQVEGGHFHTLALLNDGVVVAWGSDGQGQCAADGTSVPAPARVPGAQGSVWVSAGESYSFAISASGELLRWGGGVNAPAPLSALPLAAEVHTGINSDHAVVRGGLGAVPDLAPPTFAGVTGAAAESDTQAFVRWEEAADDATPAAELDYLVYATRGDAVSRAAPAATARGGRGVTLTGLTPNARYTVAVRARDAAGNLDANLAVARLTTLPAPDAAPPAFEGIGALSAPLTTQVTARWLPATDDASDPARIRYRLYLAPAHAPP